MPGCYEKRRGLPKIGDDQRPFPLLRLSWWVCNGNPAGIEDADEKVPAVPIAKKNFQMIGMKLCSGGRGKQPEKIWER